MQTTGVGVEDAGRKMVLNALAAERALRETAEPHVSAFGCYGDELAPQRSAMRGFKFALPFAALLWALIAGMVWVVAR